MRVLFMIFIILLILGSSSAIAISFYSMREIKKLRDDALKINQTAEKKMESVNTSLEKLEKGIVPDYEQAKAAAEAVNNFSRGVSNILGFDPVQAYKAAQQREKMGGDAE